MNHDSWIQDQAHISLDRLLPRVRDFFEEAGLDMEHQQAFERRLGRNWTTLFGILLHLYGGHYDFFYHLEQILLSAARSWVERPEDLKEMDAARVANPAWYLSEKMVGGVLYVDLFSENLARLKEHMEYFRELGLNYIHLMPLFAVPRGENDGGYAVSDYRSVNPDLGSMEDLIQLARRLRDEGISLVLDFVFNHTSDDHAWARRARDGDRYYQGFYYMFDDRTLPDQYERTLRDIFPTIRRGSFTWFDELGKWVWTTFNSYQWDLNYANPNVFRAMAEEMLFLANAGVEILRLDAVAFLWKRLGTDCENLPEAHMIIRAYNALARIAAPSLAFKSEAIVHPDEVIRYISPDECQLSYNPLLMALLWEALATREVRLLEYSMSRRHRIPKGCAWVNYLRCHDDIGWTFDDQDARDLGINPHDHRKFLNDFYTGYFPGSFARGVPFQFNPENGDLRISGTFASLAGLEQALALKDEHLVDMALRRIFMLRSVILAASGIPLFYLGGDEWGVLNDYGYVTEPTKASDSRWVHRPRTRWGSRDDWRNPDLLERRIYDHLIRTIELRKRQPAFQDSNMEVVSTGNGHLFGFLRWSEKQRILVLANFSEYRPSMDSNRFRLVGSGYRFTDHLSGEEKSAGSDLVFEPYQCMWLEARHR
ncbi:MAG: amylosucrase [Desulfatibacillaceae bacterium]